MRWSTTPVGPIVATPLHQESGVTNTIRRTTAMMAAFASAGGLPARVSHGNQAGRCSPRAYVEASLAALGGKAKLRGLATERVTGVQEVSGIPWSPHAAEFRPNYEEFSELRDLQSHRLRRHVSFQAASHAAAATYMVTVDVPDSLLVLTVGGHDRLLPRGATATFAAGLASEPQTVMQDALAASDLRCGADTTIDG